jgi:PAS domain S-box-containing protein
MKVSSEPSKSVFANAKLRFQLASLGIVLGIMLVVIALTVDILSSQLSFGFTTLITLYESNAVHWIILTSPVFLGVFFFVMGKMISEREQQLEAGRARDARQYALLEGFVDRIEDGCADGSNVSAFDNVTIANKLMLFKERLRVGREEEQNRTWENEGLARFGELLRSQQDIDNLADDVLRFLVKYVNGNQGSVFVLSHADQQVPVLEMKACYAYDRKKYVNATVGLGEGLVGQCYMERETIILHDVPKNYIKITSGLGMATPSFVCIIPIKTDDAVAGIFELAAFHRLKQHEISFLERACSAFASVISTVMTNHNVTRLLHESQQQTEELRAQEEEMRQNMEELQAIQEQMSRQLEENTRIKKDLEHREHVLAKTTILSESDLFGTITYVNEKFCEVSQYTASELLGKPHHLLRHRDMPAEVFKQMWATIKSGRTFQGIVKNRKKDGTHYWVDATIVPVVENGKIIKYIGARYHIKDEAMAERLFQQQLLKLGLSEREEVRMVS